MPREDILRKIARYCAYRERSHQEVRSKLLENKVYGQELEEVLVFLIEEDFLNEERYARAYARGKFRNNQWGKTKIIQGLRRQKISEYCLNKALSEIDENDYQDTLQNILEKKRSTFPDSIESYKLFQKLSNYALQKGYEYELIKEKLKKIITH